MTAPKGPMPAPCEKEFKLRATRPIEIAAIDAALRETGLLCAATDSTRHLDTYLDDAAGRLAAAGIGLRLREDRRGRHLGCKHRTRRDGALFVRDELEAPWPSAALPQDAADLPAALRDVVEPFLLGGCLAPVLQLATERDTRQLVADGQRLCEVAIDRVTTQTGPQPEHFLEVEIEVHDDLATCARLAALLVTGLPLAAVDDDKPTHAAALLGLSRAPAAEPPLHAGQPAQGAIAASARRHLAAMQHAEIGVRLEPDPVPLHEMRVALRRLRGLVRAFRPLWPDDVGQWLLAELGDTARRLGVVRDLDVLLAELPATIDTLPAGLRDAARTATDRIREHRDTERDALRAWLRDPERLARCRQLRDALAGPMVAPNGCVPIGEAAAPPLAAAAATVRRLAKALPPELPLAPLHELRIACKRLRYLGEEFAALPELAPARAVATLTTLQQALGAVCDHETAAARLVGWIPQICQDQPAAVAALGGLATSHHLAAEAARKRAGRRLDRAVRKKLWRAFPKVAEQDANLAP